MVVLGWKTIYECTARVPEIEWMLQRRKRMEGEGAEKKQ